MRRSARAVRSSSKNLVARALLLPKFSGDANSNFDQRRRLRGSVLCRSYKMQRAGKIISCPASHAMPPHMRAGNSSAPQDRRGMSWSASAQCVFLKGAALQPSTGTALYDAIGQRSKQNSLSGHIHTHTHTYSIHRMCSL